MYPCGIPIVTVSPYNCFSPERGNSKFLWDISSLNCTILGTKLLRMSSRYKSLPSGETSPCSGRGRDSRNSANFLDSSSLCGIKLLYKKLLMKQHVAYRASFLIE